MSARALTTAARLRHIHAALCQAATLAEEAANLGGGLTDDTRLALRLAAAEYREQADFAQQHLAARCARDLDAVRAARAKREAA